MATTTTTTAQKLDLPRGITGTKLPTGGYSIRWRDPVTRKIIERRIHVDAKAALVYGRKQHELNVKARHKRNVQEVAAFANDSTLALEAAAERTSIADECKRFYAKLARPENRSANTLRHAEESLFMFLSWCETQGFTHLDELTGPRLLSFADHLHALRKANGKHYKVSTVNQWMKYSRSMLRVAAAQERCTLNYDKIRENMKHTKIAKQTDKALHGIDTSRALRPEEIKRLLLAALKYDARDRTEDRVTEHGLQRQRPLAPDLAMLLLSGLRRREYTYLTCAPEVVSYCVPDKAMLIELPDLLSVERGGHTHRYPIAKGLAKRSVFFAGVSPLGSQLLHELVQGRGADEWISLYSYQHLADALKQSLRAYGAPKCTAHDLRATCATYQLSVLGLDLERATKRLGHTPSIARESYLQRVPGQPFGVASLEKAMGCEREFKLVLKALQARGAIERRERRPLHAVAQTQALLSKDPLHLRDALAKRRAPKLPKQSRGKNAPGTST